MAAIGPIDYSTGADSPLKAFDDAFTTGAKVQEVQTKQAQQQQQLEMQRQLTRDTNALAANPTTEGIANLSIKYPQLSEQFKRTYDMMNSQQQEARLNASVPIYAAVTSGNTDVAVKLLTQQADAYANAGRSSDAQQARTMAQLVKDHPETAKTSMGIMLASVMGPDKFAATFGTVSENKRAEEVQPGKVAVSNAEGVIKTAEATEAPTAVKLNNAEKASVISDRAARMGLDRDKLTSETQIKVEELKQKNPLFNPPDDAKKLINESASSAVTSAQYATQLTEFADKIQQAGPASGIVGKGYEAWKNITGSQDAVSTLRQEYVRLRSQGAMKMMPPGSASDKDVALVMAGFPEATASPDQMASFARGMSKLALIDSAANTAKAEWVNFVGHLGKSKSDMSIDGIYVAAGTSFVDFTKAYVTKKAAMLEQENVNKKVQDRSYMKYGVSTAVAPKLSDANKLDNAFGMFPNGGNPQ